MRRGGGERESRQGKRQGRGERGILKGEREKRGGRAVEMERGLTARKGR